MSTLDLLLVASLAVCASLLAPSPPPPQPGPVATTPADPGDDGSPLRAQR